MKIGPISDVVLLGGGEILQKLAIWAKQSAINVRVITSPRHARELFERVSLSEFLLTNKIDFIITDDISSTEVKEFLKGKKKKKQTKLLKKNQKKNRKRNRKKI